MLFDEVTRKTTPLSILDINEKLQTLKEEYGDIEVVFDFGEHPTTIIESDYPSEYFINYSEDEIKIEELLSQIKVYEDEIAIQGDFLHYDTEVVVGKNNLDETYQNLSIIDIIEEDDKIIIQTEETF